MAGGGELAKLPRRCGKHRCKSLAARQATGSRTGLSIEDRSDPYRPAILPGGFRVSDGQMDMPGLLNGGGDPRDPRQGLKEVDDEISLVLLCWPDTVTTPNHERLVCLPV